MIRVIVIDENNQYREEFCKILQRAGFNVVLSANRDLCTIAQPKEAQAELAIVDFHDTDPKSFMIAETIKELSPEIKLIFHTLYPPRSKIRQLHNIGNGLIVKQYYEVHKGFQLIDQVLNNSVSVFSDKKVIKRKSFWVLDRLRPDFPYMLSDKAIAAVKGNKQVIMKLSEVYSRPQVVIESWLEVNDERLVAPGSMECICDSCNLRISEVMVETSAGIFQVMV